MSDLSVGKIGVGVPVGEATVEDRKGEEGTSGVDSRVL